MIRTPNYLKDQICLNVLANSLQNAKECYEAAEGHILLGGAFKNYPNDEAAIKEMKQYQEATNNALSIGLGAGDPNQKSDGHSISQSLATATCQSSIYRCGGATRAVLGQSETVVNGLVSPTGKKDMSILPQDH